MCSPRNRMGVEIRVSLYSPPMKGGRLHRLERPPAAHITTAAAATTPAPAPADDWGDGSWTVDCSCGITYDDGEEMVSCDECNVWVHTRCARYVRGVHISFSCHNCKAKRAPSSADEAEVAELLAELPTHRPRPLYRRWAEVPLPSRVHVHGLPGGTDTALFRSAAPSPVFSSALWRCAGYVPKRFGFRYCEFPYWADDKDGANALFALAREKRKEKAETRFPLRLGAIHKDKNYVRTLSICGDKVDGVEHSVDDDAKRTSPPSDAKKRGTSISIVEPDTWDNGCEKKRDFDVPASEDQHAKTNMVNSDLHVLVEAKKKRASSSERSGDKKCSASKEITGMLKKYEPKESKRLVISSGVATTAAVAEQEVHSRFVKGSVYEGLDGNQNVGLQTGVRSNGVVKRDDVKRSNGDVQSDAAPEKMNEGLDLQKQSNQTSNLLVVGGVPDLQTNQSESLTIKKEASTDDHERTEAIQFVSDEHKSGKQDTAMLSTLQRHSSKLASDLVYQHPKSETQNPMHTIPEHPNSSLEPSSEETTVRLVKKDQTRLVSSADSENDFAKKSESSQDRTRSSDKVQLKGFVPSAPKSSQGSRTYVSSAKNRFIVPKEQLQKTSTEGNAPPGSLQASAELQSTETTASLSDEQLALLLHQQLNSSPRVPRVPRCHQASTMQMLHPTGASVLKKRNKDDAWRDNDETKKTGKVSSVERRHRDSSTERVLAAKDSCKFTENIESEQRNRGICSTGATSGVGNDAPIDRGVSHDLPGLIEEIISKNTNITYGELCNAIRQHWGDLSKPNVENNAYPNYLHAVNDCLRNRNDWAHLVDQAAMMNPNKRRKVEESDSLSADVLATEKTNKEAKRGPEDTNAESHHEILPRGKRKARKCRRLELKGRRVNDTRKRSSFDSASDDDDTTLSDSSSDRNDTPMDKSLEDSFVIAKNADSSS
uniref:Zinc finger PHD-type domain-containing protein n=1 Tax=Oryza rufipogon TaxID=4529 RepID=A0A0E0P632_ORYRU